jgi:hypothetical protein
VRRAAGSESGHNYEVYVDQTWNNGQNWNTPVGGIVNQAWLLTPFHYDAPNHQDRDCLYDMDQSLVACGLRH